MANVPLFYKTKLEITDTLLESLHNLHLYFKTNLADHIRYAVNHDKTVLEVMDFQLPNPNIKGPITQTHKQNVNLRVDNKDTEVVREFLDRNFSSHWQFRIDVLYANSELSWHDCHPYPRVFIPMHENKGEFTIKHLGKNITNSYQPPECWFWDVRKLHMVANKDLENPRIMACFNIDPDLETKLLFN